MKSKLKFFQKNLNAIVEHIFLKTNFNNSYKIETNILNRLDFFQLR